MRNWKTFLLVGLCVAMAAFFAGCGTETSTQTPEQQKATQKKLTEVRIGVLRLTSSAPIFVGMEKGFFEEEGIALKPLWFEAAQPIAVATASNETDVGATGLTAGLYNLAAGGQTPYIVADKGRETTKHPSSYVVVTKDVYKDGLRSLEDLKGKKIGNTQTGSTYQYMLGNLLEQRGMELDDVEFANLGKLSAIMAALQSRQITGAILNEPNASMMTNAGYVEPILAVGEELHYQTSAIFYSPNFAAQDDLALRFMRAYIKSCRYYFDTVFTSDEESRAERLHTDQRYSDLVKIISKYTMTPDADINKSLPYIDRDGQLDKADVGKQLAWYYQHGFMQETLTTEQVVRTDFWERAYESLRSGKTE